MYNELITSIFQVCIIPLLGVLTTFFVKWVNSKNEEIQMNIDEAIFKKYMDILTDTITSCVVATNQTYVESLKAQGRFDAEAQKAAFNMTSTAVLEILSDEAKFVLTMAVGDLNSYIAKKIEAEVNINKTVK